MRKVLFAWTVIASCVAQAPAGAQSYADYYKVLKECPKMRGQYDPGPVAGTAQIRRAKNVAQFIAQATAMGICK